MVFVKEVNTNLKKKQSVKLGQKTLIVGKNGSGKSSLLNSLELCFGGYVADYRGKVVKSQGDLIRLANGDELKVQCKCSDGSTSSVVVKKTKSGTVSKPKKYGKTQINLPMQEVTTILEGSARVFKTWLLGKISSSVDMERVEEICKKHKIDMNSIEVDRLIETIEAQVDGAKTRVNSIADFIRTREKTITEFSKTIDPNVDLAAAQQYDQLVSLLVELRSKRERLTQCLEYEQSTQKIISSRQETINSFQGRLDTINQNSHLLANEQEVAAYNIRKDLIAMLELHHSLNATGCMVCDGNLTQVEERISKLQGSNTETENKIEILKVKAQLTSQLNHVIAQQEKDQCNLAGVQSEIDKLKKDFDQYGSFDLSDLEEKKNLLKEKKDSAQLYHLRLKEVERIKAEHLIKKNELKEAKNLQNALLEIQTELVEGAKSTFTSKLNEYLSFQVDLIITGKNIDLGKVVGEDIHYGLSGAEYLELKFALSQFIAEGNTLILSEDKAIDSERLQTIMAGFSTFSGQVVLTSTHKPPKIPDSWILIELE